MYCFDDGLRMSKAIADGAEPAAYVCPKCGTVQIYAADGFAGPAVWVYANTMEAAGQHPELFQPGLFGQPPEGFKLNPSPEGETH